MPAFFEWQPKLFREVSWIRTGLKTVESRVSAAEREAVSPASLMMLPRSSNGIVYSKFLGSLLGWLPGPIFLLVMTLSTELGRRSGYSIISNEGDGWCVVMLFAMIPHFAPFVALYVRWGAVPLAIGLTFGVYFAIVSCMFMMGPSRSQANMDAYLFISTIVLICVCVACHVGVPLRVHALGAK
jgi:hypothetical protein